MVTEINLAVLNGKLRWWRHLVREVGVEHLCFHWKSTVFDYLYAFAYVDTNFSVWALIASLSREVLANMNLASRLHRMTSLIM